MLTKRIIPCLDIRNGRTVKGTNFVNLRDLGDPVELSAYYAEQGADELVFLDITATDEKRRTLAELVRKVGATINLPFTVGGGINKLDDVSVLLENGADKISINTAAVKNPRLIYELAKAFGSQCIVVAIDTKNVEGTPLVFQNAGKVPTRLRTTDWARQVEELGAGEILLTSIDHDGTRNGFALELTRIISEMVNIPVVASGGAGNMEHFAEVFTTGKADAALAAGIFHEKQVEIPELKLFLKSKNIAVRI